MRADAEAIFGAAIAAADPALALRKQLRLNPMPPPADGGRSILIAIGKAAPAMMAEALHHVRGDHVALVVTHSENQAEVPGATVLRSGHPIPDERGLEAGKQVSALLRGADEKDQIIVLISGGGSALLPAPVTGLTLMDKIRTNEVLLNSGFDIVQMNLVRQRLSQLKGGGFLKLAGRANVTGYVLSDVIDDDIRAVASGPTAPPIGSHADARRSCIEAGIWHLLTPAVRSYLEQSIPDQPECAHAENHLIGSNRISLDAACVQATRSYEARIVSNRLTGDVAEAAETILNAMEPKAHPQALLFGGETTVQVRGSGLGGRNQELALRFAQLAQGRDLAANWVFLSGGTDGRDGPTDAAGAIVDAGTLTRIRNAGHDCDALLANNDSHAALKLAGDLLNTGTTGTNVADIQVLLLAPVLT